MSNNNMNRSNNNECRVYVGNLPQDVRETDLEDIFYKYGKVAYIDLKKRGPGPPYSFVEFEDRRDAEDAVYGRNGYEFDGSKLRVEFPRGGRNNSNNSGDRGDWNDRGDRGGDRGGSGGSSRGGFSGGRRPFTARRSEYRVLISGLPPSGSWQDLKDHMREAGDVLFTDVFRDGTGIVEFARNEDMKYAVKHLDDTKFRSHEGEIAYVRVKEDKNLGNSRSRSRSLSPRKKSRSRSPASPRKRSYSPRRSVSRSPRRSASRSRSRSRSRS